MHRLSSRPYRLLDQLLVSRDCLSRLSTSGCAHQHERMPAMAVRFPQGKTYRGEATALRNGKPKVLKRTWPSANRKAANIQVLLGGNNGGSSFDDAMQQWCLELFSTTFVLATIRRTKQGTAMKKVFFCWTLIRPSLISIIRLKELSKYDCIGIFVAFHLYSYTNCIFVWLFVTI